MDFWLAKTDRFGANKSGFTMEPMNITLGGGAGETGTAAPGSSDTYALLETAYTTTLKACGVRLPGKTSAFGLALCCLLENLGSPVHIDAIREYVTKRGVVLAGGDTLQVRHLAMQYGWNMLKGGQVTPSGQTIPKSHFCLLTIESPHPSFLPAVRSTTLTDEEWTGLKAKYDNKCVICASKEGEPMRWDIYTITVLQKGHMDPRKALTLGNVIPQCRCCNQQYKDKAVFNERGYVTEMLH